MTGVPFVLLAILFEGKLVDIGRIDRDRDREREGREREREKRGHILGLQF